MQAVVPPHYSPDQSELPAYESRVYLNAKFNCKQEFVNPFRANISRRWLKVDATLNNTQLVLKFKSSKTKVLSMQYAQVGFAIDYKKGHFPIRLRANGMQFLFEMNSMFEAVQWLLAINLSIGISLPLDLREMPPERYQATRLNGQGRSRHYFCPKTEKENEAFGCNMHYDDFILCPTDIPENVYFKMKEFGILYKTATWEGSCWFIDNHWSLVEDRNLYIF